MIHVIPGDTYLVHNKVGFLEQNLPELAVTTITLAGFLIQQFAQLRSVAQYTLEESAMQMTTVTILIMRGRILAKLRISQLFRSGIKAGVGSLKSGCVFVHYHSDSPVR